jgi:hypothetical protein
VMSLLATFTVFALCLVTALNVAEAAAVHFMFRPAFDIGRVLWSKEYLPLTSAMPPSDTPIKTSTTVVRLLPDERSAVFRRRVRLLEVNTPFPFKGSIFLGTNKVLVRGRLPIGPTIFMIMWVGMVLLCAVFAAVVRGERGASLALTLLIMSLFFTFIVTWSVRLERRRFQQTIADLETVLGLKQSVSEK